MYGGILDVISKQKRTPGKNEGHLNKLWMFINNNSLVLVQELYHAVVKC